jgi:hypothetical protein
MSFADSLTVHDCFQQTDLQFGVCIPISVDAELLLLASCGCFLPNIRGNEWLPVFIRKQLCRKDALLDMNLPCEFMQLQPLGNCQ